MALYINDDGGYKKSESIPTSGYKLNTEKSYCSIDDKKDTSIALEYSNGKINVKNLTKKGTKCYLYFDKNYQTVESILASKTIATRTDFSAVLTEDTTGTVYSAEDDYGTSYYYAGAVKDNWVKFAGFYWRIIRINGDGTIRMIYNGPTTDQTGETTTIGGSKFNNLVNDNMYVGLQYTSGEVHGRGTDSTIKGILDSWYSDNLNSYANYITTGEGATFCNDRQPSSVKENIDGKGGTGTTVTYYGAYIRLNTYREPTYKCTDTKDRFATSTGLITADEVAYAGGVWNVNNLEYYLYDKQFYWTMSPHGAGGNTWSAAFVVYEYGPLSASNVHDIIGVRPVINLKSNTVFVGSGFSSDPYVVL